MYTFFIIKRTVFAYVPRTISVSFRFCTIINRIPFCFQKCPDLVDESYGHPLGTLKTLLSPGGLNLEVWWREFGCVAEVWWKCGHCLCERADSGVRPPGLWSLPSRILAVQVGHVLNLSLPPSTFGDKTETCLAALLVRIKWKHYITCLHQCLRHRL